MTCAFHRYALIANDTTMKSEQQTSSITTWQKVISPLFMTALTAFGLLTLKTQWLPLTMSQQDAFAQVLWICQGVIWWCFIVGELTGNNSQVDKLWSIVPAVYAWFLVYKAAPDPLCQGWDRMALVASLVSLWALRLTYNFYRRGGYSLLPWKGEEDYRWAVLRAKAPLNRTWVWTLFNMLFICFYQNALILLFTLPVLAIWQAELGALTWIDGALALLFLGLLLLEFVADQQQYDYQTEKYRRKAAGEALTDGFEKGFVHQGLWRLMRHPNYAAEQAIWIVVYLFSAYAGGAWLNWSIAGCVLLIGLFKGSSDFSEGISAEKYPAYAEYQKKTGRFLPRLSFGSKA